METPENLRQRSNSLCRGQRIRNFIEIIGPMSGHRPFNIIRKRMAPARRARNARAARRMMADMTLRERVRRGPKRVGGAPSGEPRGR
jgi:hypothetical protein